MRCQLCRLNKNITEASSWREAERIVSSTSSIVGRSFNSSSKRQISFTFSSIWQAIPIEHDRNCYFTLTGLSDGVKVDKFCSLHKYGIVDVRDRKTLLIGLFNYNNTFSETHIHSHMVVKDWSLECGDCPRIWHFSIIPTRLRTHLNSCLVSLNFTGHDEGQVFKNALGMNKE